MKVKKFYKNLYQALSCFVPLVLLEIPLLVCFFSAAYYESDMCWIFLIISVCLIILFFLIGFYWLFQIVTINEDGIRISIITKTIKAINWQSIITVEICNRMRNPELRVILRNGEKLYLNNRKKIRQYITENAKISIECEKYIDDNLR